MSRFRTLSFLPNFSRTLGLTYRYVLFAAFGALLVVFLSNSASAQNQPPSDPQALTYAAQSIAAMAGSTTISDVTLTGTVTWYGAGTDTGTATLRALGTGESRIDLTLTAGIRTEIRDAQTGVQLGQWIAPNNISGNFASQNCWTDAVWFFPVLGSLAAGPNVVLSYVGPTTWNGESVQQIQSYVYQSTQTGLTPTPQQLSTMNFYLDATTLLPAAVTFNAHPDNNAATNLLVEVDFSNYQTFSGVVVPTHIQKYQQGNLMVDVVVTAASFNTGLSPSIFTIN
jgi:outer membrane lipoprotein-sorting protein